MLCPIAQRSSGLLVALLLTACGSSQTPLTPPPPLPPPVPETSASSPVPVPPSSSSAASPAREPPTRLSQDQALRDLRHLVRLLETSHPDPYTPLGGKVAFRRRAQQLLKSLPAEGISTREFSFKLQSFLAGLHDGHTFLDEVSRSLRNLPQTVPVRFGVYPSGLFVSGYDLPALDGTRGFKLLALQGVPVRTLLDTLGRTVPVENDSHALAWLRKLIGSDQGLALLLPSFKPGDALAFDLESPSGVKTRREIPAGQRGEVRTHGWRQEPLRWKGLDRTDAPFAHFFLGQGKIAYFKVSSIQGRESYEMALRYGWGNPTEMMQRYYQKQQRPMPSDPQLALAGIPSLFEAGEQLLRDMKQRDVRVLILDLRGNGGGATPTVFPFLYQMYGDAFFARPLPGEFVTVHSQLYLDQHHKTLEQWRAQRKEPEFQLGDYEFDEEPPAASAQERRGRQLAEYREKGMSFANRLEALQGKPIHTPETIAVLCDVDTFSAAFHFLFYLRSLGAWVIGMPPAQAPNAFMEITPFVLPESLLHGSLSNSAQLMIPTDPGLRVLRPDHVVSWDVLRKFDFDEESALRFALELLAQGRLKGQRKPAP